MATLAQNIQRAINDFNSIENAIVQKGVPVPDGTPTSEYAEKVEDVFEAGKKSEHDAFWDEFQDYGNAVDYGNAFNQNWNDANFKPKYDIAPKIGSYIFMHSKISNIKNSLLVAGVALDFSKVTGTCYNAFYNCQTTELPELVLNITKAVQLFYLSIALRTIDKLIVWAGLEYDQVFRGCRSLTNLTIEGTIGQNGFDVSWSPLDKPSLTSIVNALSATTTGLTVTLRLSAVDTAFETTAGAADGSTSDEWTALIATKPNWTIKLINS